MYRDNGAGDSPPSPECSLLDAKKKQNLLFREPTAGERSPIVDNYRESDQQRDEGGQNAESRRILGVTRVLSG